MRRTGKLYGLTLVSCALGILAAVLVACWSDNTSQFHLWADVVPQGLGMASVITTTLIVSHSPPYVFITIEPFLLQAMIASVTKEDLAVATGSESNPILDILCNTCADCFDVVTYLFRTTGQVLGVSLSGAVLQAVLVSKLRNSITGPNAAEVRRYYPT